MKATREQRRTLIGYLKNGCNSDWWRTFRVPGWMLWIPVITTNIRTDHNVSLLWIAMWKKRRSNLLFIYDRPCWYAYVRRRRFDISLLYLFNFCVITMLVFLFDHWTYFVFINCHVMVKCKYQMNVYTQLPVVVTNSTIDLMSNDHGHSIKAEMSKISE